MATDEHKEALRFIAEWCKWTAVVATAVIAAIGAFLHVEKGQPLSWWVGKSSAVAALLMVLSVIISGIFLTSLPTIVQAIKPGGDIWRWSADFIVFKAPYFLR